MNFQLTLRKAFRCRQISRKGKSKKSLESRKSAESLFLRHSKSIAISRQGMSTWAAIAKAAIPCYLSQWQETITLNRKKLHYCRCSKTPTLKKIPLKLHFLLKKTNTSRVSFISPSTKSKQYFQTT